MSQKSNRLPGKVVAAYTFSSLASNSMWMLNNYFLLFFYTDVLRIPAEAAAVIFTIARFWDAINDPMMGVICDRTRSKEGKSRFWLRRIAIPGGVFLALSYFCPNWATPAKIIWAGVVYILQGMAQTAIGISSNALTISITHDRNERVRLGQFTAVPSMLANVLIPALTMPIVRSFHDMGTGFFIIALVIGAIYTVSTLLVERTTKGMDPDTSNTQFTGENSAQRIGMIALIKAAVQNKYSTMVLLGNMAYMLLSGLMGSTLIYYFSYYVGNENLMGVYSTAVMAGMLICIFTMGFIAKKIGNANSVILGAVICLIAFIPRIITGDRVTQVFAVCIAAMGFGSGLISNMMMQCRNDATIYGQLHGVDNSGILMSLYTFSQKLGQAISSVVAAALLAAFNYIPGEAPNSITLKLFFAENITIPMVIAVVVIALLLVVSHMEKQLVKDLAAVKAGEQK